MSASEPSLRVWPSKKSSLPDEAEPGVTAVSTACCLRNCQYSDLIRRCTHTVEKPVRVPRFVPTDRVDSLFHSQRRSRGGASISLTQLAASSSDFSRARNLAGSSNCHSHNSQRTCTLADSPRVAHSTGSSSEPKGVSSGRRLRYCLRRLSKTLLRLKERVSDLEKLRINLEDRVKTYLMNRLYVNAYSSFAMRSGSKRVSSPSRSVSNS